MLEILGRCGSGNSTLLTLLCVVDVPTSEGATTRMIGLPLHFDGRNRPAVTAAPRFGADTRAVLLDQGFSRAEVDRLIEAGVVRQG